MANSKSKTTTQETTQEVTGWFKRGIEVFDKRKQIEAVAKARKERAVSRFYLKTGEDAIIVFVDSSPFGIYEHNLKIDGKWGNFYTCSKEIQPCPICQQFPENKPTWTAYLTVIDTRSFIRQSDGQEVKNRKILFPAKGTAIAKLEKLLSKYKNLAGLAFKVSRLTDQDPNCGSDFEYLGKVNIIKKFGPDAVNPIDYMKVLSFPTEEELAMLGIGYIPDGFSSEDTPEQSPDDIIDNLVDEPAEEEINISADDLIK